ncbi:sodium:solute symporter family protein [Achromobacter sp. NFACC18-2]|uniref:sodium:solute symporter family protein n=1 Tax=Achromobacter sp. NFACC18-2 TaxID=1564112 RepID=UPI0008B1BF12|nr:sodium:solute symporter family protein [Achromobacter sp. NFACC18-2]SEK09245.1 cation/acetate symporter [Achromobacter sp. NFACC18-2]
MPFFSGDTPHQFRIRLRRIYVLYTAGFALMILLMALAEILGMPRNWIGYVFLLVTVSLYAGIGIVCRTSDQVEYYVAGRRVPAIYNGMATAADWMSVASFIGVAGTLYLTGYGGLAYIMGWTGGYVLVAMLLAPYLRRFGQYTLPDFMGARYGGNLPRLAGVACAILCSFTYLVAQIYGVGIITTRMTGISFELGIFVALGGMLVCSFLGGMRAVTWTQVGQYIILVIAYLVPVIWLSVKHTNMPLPQLSGGAVLQQVTEKEVYLRNDPSEIEVRRIWQERADQMSRRLEALPDSWTLEKDKLRSRLAQLNAGDAPMVEIRSAERELAAYPPTIEDARVTWSQAKATFEARAAPPTPHAEPFPAEDPQERSNTRINFLAMVLCLMLGTAGMPHILMRSYTTPSVIEARKSVCWSLLFILLLYFMAPALALLVKFEIYTQVVGSNFLSLPNWVHAWSAVDTNLLDVSDINRDGVVQLSEISMGADVVVLAMPEIGGLPYVISGLVAAGGLAAALSTADGLLLTLSNSLSHDMWYRVVSPRMSAARRVMVSKILLLVVAFGAAWVAARKPADILFMVSAAFSFAASSFFPALVMGVFWRRANKWGATLGMAAGLAVTFAYMTHTHPWLRESVLGIARTQPVDLWWGIQPIAAGVFGAPVAFLTIVVVSLLTPPPDRATLALVDYLRNPGPGNPPPNSH